ncbi:integrase [Pseudomonas oryzihabitans]|nr:integrase [Pseudomonas psychrotolerans]
MRLVLATKDLIRAGRSFERFPLLIGTDGWPVEPAQSFLWHILVESGELTGYLTWEAYGRRLYDYFAFLEANNIAWDDIPSAPGLSCLSRYRDWSLSELKLNRSTINNRLSLIVRFYRWANSRGLISHLPFNERRIQLNPKYYLANREPYGGLDNGYAAIKVREFRAVTSFLTKEQVKKCLSLKVDTSHKLLCKLMVFTGMRSCEARTFPAKYIFNPKLRNDIRQNGMISVALSPSDMEIKNGRPRYIDVPWALMEELWSYTLYEREIRRQRSGENVDALLLNKHGRAYSKDAVVDVMRAFERKCQFRVRAHMLRHTYATYTLWSLRKSKGFEGEPLLYVRDRLGHSSVQTTTIYLHLINLLEAKSVLAYEDELDAMFTDTYVSSEEFRA